MNRSAKIWVLVCFVAFAVYFAIHDFARSPKASGNPDIAALLAEPNPNEFCPKAEEPKLPLPSSLPPSKLVGFQQTLLAYVEDNAYQDWCVDKGVRDTGPWVDGKYY